MGIVLKDTTPGVAPSPPPPVLDTAGYDQRLQTLANGDRSGRWPAKTAYPLPDAILPFHRIVAYYGNYYSTRMGALGEYPAPEMLRRLRAAASEWAAADSLTPVKPALHYIAVSAQNKPGKDGRYRLRMPFHQIDKTIALAAEAGALVFLDIQVGHSTLQAEIPLLRKYLQLPQVHLGVDPEFSMKDGDAPGTEIGTFDAADINFATSYLAEVVREFRLPPKILVIHRFTRGMLTNHTRIATRPEVQIVINMDGFGFPAKKRNTYRQCVFSEPVQFTGFKLFYKNDIKDVPHLMTPAEVLALTPRPVYIQYQ